MISEKLLCSKDFTSKLRKFCESNCISNADKFSYKQEPNTLNL